MRAEPLFLVVVIIVMATCAAKRGHCQPQPDANTLVRVWVAEARWTAYRDHAAQAHVLQRYAGRRAVSLPTAARRLVWDWSRPPAWVRQLAPGCYRPPAWPQARRWARYRPLCLALYDRARAFLRGDVADPCMYRAAGWRAPGRALRRALRRGWEPVQCGATLNVFVSVAKSG